MGRIVKDKIDLFTFSLGQLYIAVTRLSQACQGELAPEAVSALISGSNTIFADRNRNTMQDGADDTRAYVIHRGVKERLTDMYSDSKRKASDQLGSESPKKRIKSSYSETITPEAEGKPRVVPFPEKVRDNESNPW